MSEVEGAAGELGPAEVHDAAGELCFVEADGASGEERPTEVHGASGELCLAEADRAAGELHCAEADRSADDVYHPVVGELHLNRDKLAVGDLLLVLYYPDQDSDAATRPAGSRRLEAYLPR